MVTVLYVSLLGSVGTSIQTHVQLATCIWGLSLCCRDCSHNFSVGLDEYVDDIRHISIYIPLLLLNVFTISVLFFFSLRGLLGLADPGEPSRLSTGTTHVLHRPEDVPPGSGLPLLSLCCSREGLRSLETLSLEERERVESAITGKKHGPKTTG